MDKTRFLVKVTHTDGIEHKFGFYTVFNGVEGIVSPQGIFTDNKDCVLSVCTTQTDKNGFLLFTSDCVEFADGSMYIIMYDSAALNFVAVNKDGLTLPFTQLCDTSIVGNTNITKKYALQMLSVKGANHGQ